MVRLAFISVGDVVEFSGSIASFQGNDMNTGLKSRLTPAYKWCRNYKLVSQESRGDYACDVHRRDLEMTDVGDQC